MCEKSVPPPLPVVPSHWTFPADIGSVRHARRVVTDALPRGCHPQLVEDLRLLTSEMVTNAVLHGSRLRVEQAVDLVLWPADGHYWLAVSDVGAPDLPAPAAPRLDTCGGRGLLLVDVLSAAWGVVPRPAVGKTVVAGLRLTARQHP